MLCRYQDVQARRVGRDHSWQNVLDRKRRDRFKGKQAQGFQIGQWVGFAARQVCARLNENYPVGQFQLFQGRKDMAAGRGGADGDAESRFGQ